MADRRGNSVERYYASKEKRRKARKVRLYFFLSLFCIATFVVLSLTVFFNIRSFEISGNTKYADAKILSAAALDVGDNLFRLNKFEIAEQLTRDLPYISSVNIYRKLPTTLCIEVQETSARLAVYHEGKIVLMDSSLKVLETTAEIPEGPALLIGVKLSEVKAGESAVFENNAQMQSLQTLLTHLQSSFDFEKVSAIDIRELHSVNVYYDAHRVKVLLGTSERLTEKLQMAQNAIAQNGLVEKARVDVTTADAAYYRVLNEAEAEDPELIFLGKEEKVEEPSETDGESASSEQ